MSSNRAAEYLRYSSDMQNEATISAQHRIVETFAAQENYTIVKSYVDEATKKRYTPYDADYHKYDAKRREYRKARKKKLSPRK